MSEEFFRAFSLVFIAEMGDKTQILAMTCAAKYSPLQVVMGIFIGVVLNHGLAILAGIYISNIISLDILQILAGAVFVVFGIFSFVDGGDEEENCKNSRFGAVVTIAIAFFIGELGDKTQLTAMTLAMEAQYPLDILAGTTVGMLVVGSMGIIVGTAINKKIPPYIIKIVSGVIFIIFGVSKLFSTALIFIGNPLNQGILIVSVGIVSLKMVSRLMRVRNNA